VSPLTRTLETARLIIKNNNLNVKHLLVLPELSEVLSKICDFSSSIDQKRKKYTGFNFSEIDRFLKENDHLKGQ
jgi:broad specificity phosphatase PhoE